jgi:hypothetical protein
VSTSVPKRAGAALWRGVRRVWPVLAVVPGAAVLAVSPNLLTLAYITAGLFVLASPPATRR